MTLDHDDAPDADGSRGVQSTEMDLSLIFVVALCLCCGEVLIHLPLLVWYYAHKRHGDNCDDGGLEMCDGVLFGGAEMVGAPTNK